MTFTRKSRTVWILAGIVWLGAVGVGLRNLWAYENLPGQSGNTPKTWPMESAIKTRPGLPTLVLFIHPHCRCSRATIGELAILMAHSQGLVNANVIFVRPAGLAAWEKTDLWRSAAEVPGVRLSADENGVEARRFQSRTSGQVALYSAEGKLVFSGGITGSRGHSGDNVGRTAIQSLLADGESATAKTPVFGCSLANLGSLDQTEEFCDVPNGK